MRNRISVATLFIAALMPATACAQTTGQMSKNVEGGNNAVVASSAARAEGLQERWNEAVKRSASASKGARFWVAYDFNIRPNVGIDEPLPPEMKGILAADGLRISLRPSSASRRVSVFALYDGEKIERVEVHDLDRYRPDGKVPVQSLGRADNAESLSLLRSLYSKSTNEEVGERLVLAMALHDDAQVASILKEIIASPSGREKEKGAAAMWLGQTPDQKGFLESLARDGQAPIEVRKQAVVGLGFSHYTGVLPVLQNLYRSVGEREVREQALFASSHTRDKAEAAAFLKGVKDSDPDPDFRRQAAVWLERLSGNDNL
jgi:hypothetical protein